MTIPEDLKTPFRDLLLGLADDKLMIGHRNSDWTGLAPMLEEDIAFSSLAQDELAHASAIYEMLANADGARADDIALGRLPEGYRCCALVELPDEFDWATAIVRRFLCDHFDLLRLERMSRSSHAELAALAARLLAEERVHAQYADDWMIRLGSAGGEAAARLRAALESLQPCAGSIAEPVAAQTVLETAGVYPPLDGVDHFERWVADLTAVTDRAGLDLSIAPPDIDVHGGRRGRHTEHLAPMLDEMCAVYRLEPGGDW